MSDARMVDPVCFRMGVTLRDRMRELVDFGKSPNLSLADKLKFARAAQLVDQASRVLLNQED